MRKGLSMIGIREIVLLILVIVMIAVALNVFTGAAEAASRSARSCGNLAAKLANAIGSDPPIC